MCYTKANLHRQSIISVPNMTATMTCSTEEGKSSNLPLHYRMQSAKTFLNSSLALDDQDVLRTPSTFTVRANKKRVCIDERVQVRTTIACHEMSQQEIDAVWYSPDEFQEITESCCKQILKLKRGETLKDKKYCARGLESHTPIRSLAKSMNRNLAHQVVFDEQERQRQTGIHSDEALSRVYLAASNGSCMWANVVGLDDQKEAENIYDETL